MTALNLPQPDLLKNRMKDIPSELVLCVPSLTWLWSTSSRRPLTDAQIKRRFGKRRKTRTAAEALQLLSEPERLFLEHALGNASYPAPFSAFRKTVEVFLRLAHAAGTSCGMRTMRDQPNFSPAGQTAFG